jgi:hypothetical protein
MSQKPVTVRNDQINIAKVLVEMATEILNARVIVRNLRWENIESGVVDVQVYTGDEDAPTINENGQSGPIPIRPDVPVKGQDSES